MAVRFDAENDTYTRSVGWGAQTAFSVSCWVYISTDRNNYSTPWSLDNGAGNNIVLQTNSDGTTLGIVSNGNWATTSLNMSTGMWYWVGVVKNGTTATVYRSTGTGTISSTNHSVTNSVTVNTLRIGQSPWGGEWLNGRVAAVKIWTAALSAGEIQAEREYTSPIRTTTLRAWYPFEVAENVDHSGNGETLSGGSSPSTEAGPSIPFAPVEDAEVTAEIPLSLVLSAQTSAPVIEDAEVTAEIPLVLALGAQTSAPVIEDAEVTADIPLSLALGAATEAGHEVASEIPLMLVGEAGTEAEHEVTADIALALTEAAATEAEHEVTADIALALTEAAATEAGHEVTADIALTLVGEAGTAAEHEVSAEVPLSLDLTPVTGAADVPAAEVWAEVPLLLGLSASSTAEHTVAAEVPLTLHSTAETSAEHAVGAAMVLTLDVIPATVAIEPTMAEVTAVIPLRLGWGAVSDADDDVLNLEFVALVPALATWVSATTPALVHSAPHSPDLEARQALTPAIETRAAEHAVTTGKPASPGVTAGKPATPAPRDHSAGPIQLDHAAPSAPAL